MDKKAQPEMAVVQDVVPPAVSMHSHNPPEFVAPKAIWFFLDDEREPPVRTDRHWVIFRTGESMLAMIERIETLPAGISFDNDLGLAVEGKHVANAILRMVMDGIVTVPDMFDFVVHSQNPIAAKEINLIMRDLLRFGMKGEC